jgi:hypothetical protein
MMNTNLTYPYFSATPKVANLLRIALGLHRSEVYCLSLLSIVAPGSVQLKKGTIAIGANKIMEAIYDDRVEVWELPYGWATHGDIEFTYRSDDDSGWAGGDRTVVETSIKSGTIVIPENGRGELTFIPNEGSSNPRSEVYGAKSLMGGWV